MFVIADPAFSVAELAAALPIGTRIAVCEDVGYPSEWIATGTVEHPPEVRSRLISVVVEY